MQVQLIAILGHEGDGFIAVDDIEFLTDTGQDCILEPTEADPAPQTTTAPSTSPAPTEPPDGKNVTAS